MTELELQQLIKAFPKEKLDRMLKAAGLTPKKTTSVKSKSVKWFPGMIPTSRHKVEVKEVEVPHIFTCNLCGHSYTKLFKVTTTRQKKSGPTYVGTLHLRQDGCDNCQEHFELMEKSQAISTLINYIRKGR
jgi:hypothetical protein